MERLGTCFRCTGDTRVELFRLTPSEDLSDLPRLVPALLHLHLALQASTMLLIGWHMLSYIGCNLAAVIISQGA